MKINIGAGPLAVLGATLTAVSGACWGYVYASAELEKKFESDLESVLDVEIKRLQQYYAVLHKDTEPEDHSEFLDDGPVVDEQHIVIPKDLLSTPEGRASIMEKISEAIEPEDGREFAGQGEDDEPLEEPVAVNAFDEQELLNERGGDAPFVISKDEYLRNDLGYETYELTFFEADGVLIDDSENAIPDTETVVGDRNLQRFGQLSGNNNVVFVQNNASKALFEIARDSRTASEALYGVSDEDELTIEHSSMKRRRPRRGDE